MSNITNSNILERAVASLELAEGHSEVWNGTTRGKILDLAVSMVTHDIDTNDLEGLVGTLKYLDDCLLSSAKEIALQSQQNFYEYDLVVTGIDIGDIF